MPKDISNRRIIGASFFSGIGLTIASFIESLALKNNPNFIASVKIGILIGSLISTIIGYLNLKWKTNKITVQHRTPNENLILK